jgi:hypothetical protein
VSQGQVASQIGDFGLSRFHTGYGMRFLVRPREITPLRWISGAAVRAGCCI